MIRYKSKCNSSLLDVSYLDASSHGQEQGLQPRHGGKIMSMITSVISKSTDITMQYDTPTNRHKLKQTNISQNTTIEADITLTRAIVYDKGQKIFLKGRVDIASF